MGVKQVLRKSKNLEKTVEQGRKRLIDGEFGLASTLCDLAETEIHRRDHKHAYELVAKAKEAAEAIRRIAQHASLPQHDMEEINARLETLEARSRRTESAIAKAAASSA